MDGAVLLTCLTLVAYDGDTFKCDGKSVRPMGDGAPHISGFDTPEIGHRAKCEVEQELGMRAKERFQQLLDTPGVKVYDSGEIDTPKFNRPLVWVVMPDGRRAGAILIDEGLAREWTPDYEADWCTWDPAEYLEGGSKILGLIPLHELFEMLPDGEPPIPDLKPVP